MSQEKRIEAPEAIKDELQARGIIFSAIQSDIMHLTEDLKKLEELDQQIFFKLTSRIQELELEKTITKKSD